MNFWHITCKDLLVLWRDRRAVVILLALPLVFITLIGLSTGRLLGWQNDNDVLRIAVLNEDPAPLASAIVERLAEHDGVHVTTVADARQARELMETGRSIASVRIGPAFQSCVDELRSIDALQFDQGRLAGDLAALDVHIEAEPTLTNLEAIVDIIVRAEVVSGVVPVVLRRNAWIRRYLNAHHGDSPAAAVQGTPEDRIAAPPKLRGYGSIVYQTIVPSYTVLFTFFLVTLMAGSFLAERDAGTLRRLQTAPLSNAALIAGKMLPFLFISLGQGALLFLAGKLLFGMGWGRHPALLPVVVFCTSLSATALGLLVATLVHSTGQVSTTATLVIIVMGGISGCFMPRAWLPQLMQQVSLATPHAWAIIAYNQLLNTHNPDVNRVLRCCSMLTGLSGLYLLVGWWRFGRKT